jgi:hypothetical protein
MTERPYKFVVRLPESMRERISEAARHYRRSMNSEIVARLEQTFRGLPEENSIHSIEPPLHKDIERIFRNDLMEDERHLLDGYRRLCKTKKRAMLELLA